MPGGIIQGALAGFQCKHCPSFTRSNEAGARMAGWRTYQGVSVTGKPLDDVVCPACAGTAEPEAPTWRVHCITCDWDAAEEGWDSDDEPLNALDAKMLAASHRCYAQVEIGPPGSSDWYHPNDVTDSGGLKRPKVVTVDLSARHLPGVAR
jgi:hypothetical protein